MAIAPKIVLRISLSSFTLEWALQYVVCELVMLSAHAMVAVNVQSIHI